ncbi:MAG TPA: DUF1844 domain-containing protein [Ignavibacteria bacterium]|nr:DUF1844 domain-containing protein [Ignavibacteria bacterium]HMR40544.1 DUF1844 domain-containing protein [Ignavibacteria bacterium]
MTEDKNTHMFLSLIYMFQMQTMVQMGKLANPMTQKIEREMEAAQVTIDMLDMLKEKTKGNLTDEESKFLEQSLADLKLNFVEEKSKIEKSSDTEAKDEKKEITEPETESGSDTSPEEKESSKSESEPSSKE